MTVCFLRSYSPRQSPAAVLAAKSIGIRTVMMNESHAGTARAARLGRWIKRRLVSLLDAALVGGEPQRRYFKSLGLPEHQGKPVLPGVHCYGFRHFAGYALLAANA